ncbi:GRAM domain-containing protein 2A-like isoform X1 [Diprion similis]|uniref:GRAM domain-containing protein 2A-like isoform X1 n=1 Tax=Diprion similis TaxID=362088 RepID=UPI001EF8CCE3|nr:GRAM domain-containing protein 2A-like isoform X1 [Diprion similis]
MVTPSDGIEGSPVGLRRVHSFRLLSSSEDKEGEVGSQLRRGGSLRIQRTTNYHGSSTLTVSTDPDENNGRPARPTRHSAPSTAAPAPEFLARSLLQLGCPIVSIPQPRGGVGSEHLPSSDSDDSLSTHSHHVYSHGQVEGIGLPKVHVSGPSNSLDPASSLNGSAGSLGARSAPSTPLQNVVLQAGQPISGAQLTVSGPNQQLPPPRSPSHTALKCSESQLSKPLSRSTPSMAASVQTVATRSSTRSSSTSTSSARQKKFHRHFSQVPAEERVLNYYSCALVADILLQGHLYITPNYFGFYSNVFGYVTKILIPTASVLKISKEKTARIIPNAVAIATEEDRHVFCSLLSRDSTFKLMKQVWDAAKEPTPAADIPLPVERKLLSPETLLVDDSEANLEEDDSSMSESGTDRTSRPPTACTDTDGFSASIPRPVATTTRIESPAPVKTILTAKPVAPSSGLWGGFRPGTIIAVLVALLAILYVSAALMMMRIDRLHAAYLNHPLASPERFTQDRLLQYLNSNLDQIVKVRQSLQTLSQQFVSMTEETDAGPISGGVIDPEDAPS